MMTLPPFIQKWIENSKEKSTAKGEQFKKLLLGLDFSGFTPRQRAILKLRFGLGELQEGESEKVAPEFVDEINIVKQRTMEEVGKIFGISRERVRQIENALLLKLQARQEEALPN